LPRPAKTKETQKLRYFSLGGLLRLLCFKDLGGNNNSVSSGRMAFLQGKGNIINSAESRLGRRLKVHGNVTGFAGQDAAVGSDLGSGRWNKEWGRGVIDTRDDPLLGLKMTSWI
jgi:hypothetical protein